MSFQSVTSPSARLAFPASMIAEANPALPRRSEASLVNLEDGGCLAAYANHTGQSDNARSHIALRRLSAEGGLAGSEWVAVHPPSSGLNAMSPALRRLPDGRLGMLYSFRLGVREARRHFIWSEDEGMTWSEPVTVAGGGYVTGCHDRFTILSSGRFIAPLHASEDWGKHYLYVRVAHSDDFGKTWKVTASMELPFVGSCDGENLWNGAYHESGCYEPGVVERADGSLLMTMRTAMGTQFCSESFDEGITWTSPRSMELISPQAPANLTRIPGTPLLLLVWSSDYDVHLSTGGDRREISVCVSTDGGLTWPRHRRRQLIRDTASSWDYPSVLYREEEIWMSFRYTEGARYLEAPASTVLMRVPLEWCLHDVAERRYAVPLPANIQ